MDNSTDPIQRSLDPNLTGREGFSRRSAKEFTQFLFVAKGSAAEVQSLLYVASDQEYLSESDFSELYDKAEGVARIISGFITSLLRPSARPKRNNAITQ